MNPSKLATFGYRSNSKRNNPSSVGVISGIFPFFPNHSGMAVVRIGMMFLVKNAGIFENGQDVLSLGSFQVFVIFDRFGCREDGFDLF